MKKFIISVQEAIGQLQQENQKAFTVVMEHGTMSVEYFAPVVADTQQPHLQDELYIIVSGDAQLFRNGETTSCSEGDVIFVPAGMEHRFESFSMDFATWAIFYGQEGGESINRNL